MHWHLGKSLNRRLRIVTLLLVGRYQGEYFDFFHLYFWQATLIAMIVSVLYGWIRIFVQR